MIPPNRGPFHRNLMILLVHDNIDIYVQRIRKFLPLKCDCLNSITKLFTILSFFFLNYNLPQVGSETYKFL